MAAADPRVRTCRRRKPQLVAGAGTRATKRAGALFASLSQRAPGLPTGRETSRQSTVDHDVLAVKPANPTFRQHDDCLGDVVWLAQSSHHGDVALHHISAVICSKSGKIGVSIGPGPMSFTRI